MPGKYFIENKNSMNRGRDEPSIGFIRLKPFKYHLLNKIEKHLLLVTKIIPIFGKIKIFELSGSNHLPAI